MRKIVIFIVLLFNFNLFSQVVKKVQSNEMLNAMASKKKIEYKNVFKELIENWNNVNSIVKMADYLNKNGLIHRAKFYYDKAYNMSKGNKKIELKLKKNQERIINLNKSIEVQKKILDENPNEYMPTVKLAGIYLGMSDFSNARLYSYKAKQLKPQNPIASMYVRTFENKLGNPTKEAIAMSSDAVFSFKKNQKENAYKLLYDAVNLSQSSPFVYQNFAKVLILDGKIGPALRCLEEAYYINNKQKSVIFECAVLNYKLKKYEESIYYLEKLIKINSDPRSLYLMSVCFEKLGDKQKAENIIKRAKALDEKLVNKIKSEGFVVVRGVKIKI